MRGSFPFRWWAFDGGLLALVVLAALSGLALPALLLDVASFWPVFALAVVVGVVLPWRRFRAWLRVLPPLWSALWLVVVVVLHLASWPPLPSASGDLTGPDAGELMEADLGIASSGGLTVRAGSDLLYTIRLARRGGSSGVPEALESGTASHAVIRVRAADDAFWFGAAGWDLSLSVSPTWTLDLSSPSVEADLRGVSLDSARLSGSGRAALPTGLFETTVNGDFLLTVPAGVPVEILGPAAVPEGWVPTGDGWRSPREGEGLVIAIEAGSVEVQER